MKPKKKRGKAKKRKRDKRFLGGRAVGFRQRCATESWQDWYHAYIQSPAWGEKLKARIELAGHKCERCGKNFRLQVHHKTYQRAGRERLQDLVCLCEDCHSTEHGQDPTNLPEELQMPKF